ncbi:MAG: hypothetical protein MK194_13265 [Roseibacillus sp.]|nr:hypothetical protein [Roseibacillus sp.]
MSGFGGLDPGKIAGGGGEVRQGASSLGRMESSAPAEGLIGDKFDEMPLKRAFYREDLPPRVGTGMTNWPSAPR